MYEFFSKLLDRQTLVMIVLGVVCMLLFVFQGIPVLNIPFKGPAGQWITLGLGILFIFLGVVSFFGLFSQKSSGEHLKNKYALKITSHKQNDLEPSPIELRGEYKKRPNAGSVFAVERNDSRHQYYIKDEVVFYNDKTWRTQINIGNGDNLPRTLIIAYFGEDTKKLYDYFIKVRQEQGHVGIKAFPSDYHILAEVTIRLQKP
jgi:hypothetical protein